MVAHTRFLPTCSTRSWLALRQIRFHPEGPQHMKVTRVTAAVRRAAFTVPCGLSSSELLLQPSGWRRTCENMLITTNNAKTAGSAEVHAGHGRRPESVCAIWFCAARETSHVHGAVFPERVRVGELRAGEIGQVYRSSMRRPSTPWSSRRQARHCWRNLAAFVRSAAEFRCAHFAAPPSSTAPPSLPCDRLVTATKFLLDGCQPHARRACEQRCVETRTD